MNSSCSLLSFGQVAGGVNGPLLDALAKKVKHHDIDCVNLFREGGPLLGTLQCTGNGTPIPPGEHASFSDLLKNCESSNRQLLNGIKEDGSHSEDLVRMCVDDAKLGRMSFPTIANDLELREKVFSPRFCVEQGTRADGTVKLRAVDDFTRSGCNPCTTPSEKLHYDSLDVFIASLRVMAKQYSIDLEFWKADIDAAYRRVPVAPEHRQFAWIFFKRRGTPLISQHFSLPFGSLASVHHWDRIGVLLFTLADFLIIACRVRFASSSNRTSATPFASAEVPFVPPNRFALAFCPQVRR